MTDSTANLYSEAEIRELLKWTIRTTIVPSPIPVKDIDTMVEAAIYELRKPKTVFSEGQVVWSQNVNRPVKLLSAVEGSFTTTSGLHERHELRPLTLKEHGKAVETLREQALEADLIEVVATFDAAMGVEE